MASTSKAFTCNTCASIFDTGELQRLHMRGPWHVYNLKRRMAQMPTLSQEQFEAQEPNSIQQKSLEDKSSSPNDIAESASESEPVPEHEYEVDEKKSPSECLFCSLDSSTMEANIDHMYSAHGLFIPEPDQLTDMEVFLGYLASIIFEYNECLYCGAEKNSLEGVQTHMKDKGHCMINLDGESELLDFWEISDGKDEETDSTNPNDDAVHVSATEMRLPSGSIITSRPETAQLRAKPVLTKSRNKASQSRIKRDETKAITEGDEGKPKKPDNRSMRTQPGSDRRVAVRGEMGLIGLPEHQRRSLMSTEVKMKKREAIVKAAQRWATEKVANKQKFFRPDVPGRKTG